MLQHPQLAILKHCTCRGLNSTVHEHEQGRGGYSAFDLQQQDNQTSGFMCILNLFSEGDRYWPPTVSEGCYHHASS